ncbi:hypothetical protein D3C71_1862140 [compost metagenome]
MINDQVGSQFAYPVAGLRAGGGADDGQGGELAGQLGQDRTHATRGANDQQALSLVGLAFAHLQAFKQQFPGGNRGQRQGRRFGKPQ